MAKLSDKAAVADLITTCVRKGIRHAVLSPGSRNAPLIISLDNHPDVTCYVVPDERAAAFVALGMAQQLQQPVILACTSGSAGLNYAPALAEAYYQHVPLLVLTADRPVEWTDQSDGQTMRQFDLFRNFIRGSFQMPQEVSDDDQHWHAGRIASEAVNACSDPVPGPVHINLPFREPLYGQSVPTKAPKVIETVGMHLRLPPNRLQALADRWNISERKLILTGLLPPNEKLNKALASLAQDPTVAVMTETTSNLHDEHFLPCIDRLVFGLEAEPDPAARPDILITCGGPVISKKIKALLRHYRPNEHWHVDAALPHPDTYKSLTHSIGLEPRVFLEQLASLATTGKGNYQQAWHDRDAATEVNHQAYLKRCVWSDLKVFENLLSALPENSMLHLGNSTPVRYAQLFKPVVKVRSFANRGVSGIDGCTSTAVGAAIADGGMTTVITGDMGFFYDTNAMWHRHLPKHLRIILINNGGGSIFKIIPGPATTDQLQHYFEAKHRYTAEHHAATFGLTYYQANDEASLTEALDKLYDDHDQPVLLEIDTRDAENEQVLHEYIQRLTAVDGSVRGESEG